MLKVRILATCTHCNGEAYQPISEAEDCQGNKYTRYAPCPICEGSGNVLASSQIGGVRLE